MSRDPRREKYTICTAVAPDDVFTVRTYGTRQLYGHAANLVRTSSHHNPRNRRSATRKITQAEIVSQVGSQKAANRAHAQLRAPGERANAQLKTWRILRKLRCCPWRAGQLAKAIHVLQTREIAG